MKMDAYVKKPSDIGILVRNIRIAKGLSQERAAGLTGVGRRFLSELERGEKDSLDLGKVLQVLSRFGVKIKLEVPDDGKL
ncbi:MAG: helix-turn-helix domain-containing protein [Pseudobdellovibrionaceae bacterium]